jgi:hypothetical protein
VRFCNAAASTQQPRRLGCEVGLQDRLCRRSLRLGGRMVASLADPMPALSTRTKVANFSNA